jgi:asparagine synthase (glutamine-hydrolysing)
MSGLAAILNLDGAPVDQPLLERMTRELALRGPSAQQTWSRGAVGLGHSLLRAADEAQNEHQPASIQSRLWIVADARLDAREELIAKLNSRSAGRPPLSLATPDVELILHAYEAWEESCVDYLLGDFAFAIWDERKQKLLCARDHIGIKPLYYARVANTLLVSNTLQVLRLHPGVSSDLSDVAIGDFLLFGINLQTGQSAFEDIKKLPAAHSVSATSDGIRVRRYWSFPIEEPLRYPRAKNYLEEFRALLDAAVTDRLRTSRVSVSMSGGLDSPTVAAVAARLLRNTGSLQAITIVYDEVIPDEEHKYAGIVASHLQIPIQFLVVENYALFERCEPEAAAIPEPNLLELSAIFDDRNRIAAQHGSVMLTGEGGDTGFIPSLSFYRGPRAFELLGGVTKYLLAQGRLPRLGFRRAWLKWRGLPTGELPQYPEWLEPGFEARAGLRERWQEMMAEPTSAHPDRPRAYSSLSEGHWSAYCESYDASCTRTPLEVRHPFLDLRLQRFLLRLPPLPWCADKELLRQAMRGELPREILGRPKTPLAGNPYVGLLRKHNLKELLEFDLAPGFSGFVVRDQLPATPAAWGQDPGLVLRAISLNYWLQMRPILMYK